MFSTLYTIGTSGKRLRDFVAGVREAGIDLVIDTRDRSADATSRRAARLEEAAQGPVTGLARPRENGVLHRVP